MQPSRGPLKRRQSAEGDLAATAVGAAGAAAQGGSMLVAAAAAVDGGALEQEEGGVVKKQRLGFTPAAAGALPGCGAEGGYLGQQLAVHAVAGVRKLQAQLGKQQQETAAGAANLVSGADLEAWARGLSGAELAGLQGVLAAEAMRRCLL